MKKPFTRASNDNKGSSNNKAAPPYRLGLALQGGGSYGAFTKGALIALLEDGIVDAEKLAAVTGTSAGAQNGALLAYGLNSGTPRKAASLLNRYWNEVGNQWVKSTRSPFPMLNMMMPPPVSHASYPNLTGVFRAAATMVTPPEGFMIGELRKLLTRHIPNFAPLQNGPVKLFVNATREDMKTGQRSHYVFKGKELTRETIPLSGNLKEFGAASYKGAHWYDGAYWRNPCMTDIQNEGITDLMVITIQRKPKRPIVAQHQDLARALHALPGHELITEEIHDHLAYIRKDNPKLHLHAISLEVEPHWDDTSRMSGEPEWLDDLALRGYRAAKQWATQHRALLGLRSSYKKPNYAANNPLSPDKTAKKPSAS